MSDLSHKYTCWFDGMCEPKNPGGNIGIGAYITDPGGKRIFELSDYIPAEEMDFNTSNNVAEYMAVISVMEHLIKNNITQDRVVVCGDSKMAIEQLSGHWRAKGGTYLPYYHKAIRLKGEFKNIEFYWVPREHNVEADRLSKCEAIRNGCEIKLQKNL